MTCKYKGSCRNYRTDKCMTCKNNLLHKGPYAYIVNVMAQLKSTIASYFMILGVLVVVCNYFL